MDALLARSVQFASSTFLCCLLTFYHAPACRLNATFAILSVAMSSVWLSLIAGEVVALLEALGHIWGFDTVRGQPWVSLSGAWCCAGPARHQKSGWQAPAIWPRC